MKREAILTGILILVFVLGVIYLIFSSKPVNDFVKNNLLSPNNTAECTNCNNETAEPNQINTETSEGGATAGGAGGAGGGSEGGASSGESGIENSGITLPEDISQQPCGFYSGEYGEIACGGYCEKGTCVTEGRSCYCRE